MNQLFCSWAAGPGGEELLAHPVVDRPAEPRPVDGGVGLEGGVVSARVLYGLLDTATPRP